MLISEYEKILQTVQTGTGNSNDENIQKHKDKLTETLHTFNELQSVNIRKTQGTRRKACVELSHIARQLKQVKNLKHTGPNLIENMKEIDETSFNDIDLNLNTEV